MAKKKERFIVAYRQGGITTETKILVDLETGINYLYHQSSNSGGLTVLLGRDGKPAVTDMTYGTGE